MQPNTKQTKPQVATCKNHSGLFFQIGMLSVENDLKGCICVAIGNVTPKGIGEEVWYVKYMPKSMCCLCVFLYFIYIFNTVFVTIYRTHVK